MHQCALCNPKYGIRFITLYKYLINTDHNVIKIEITSIVLFQTLRQYALLTVFIFQRLVFMYFDYVYFLIYIQSLTKTINFIGCWWFIHIKSIGSFLILMMFYNTFSSYYIVTRCTRIHEPGFYTIKIVNR